eukprot:7237641-Pyramimonas_sp.AAC.1
MPTGFPRASTSRRRLRSGLLARGPNAQRTSRGGLISAPRPSRSGRAILTMLGSCLTRRPGSAGASGSTKPFRARPVRCTAGRG